MGYIYIKPVGQHHIYPGSKGSEQDISVDITYILILKGPISNPVSRYKNMIKYIFGSL